MQKRVGIQGCLLGLLVFLNMGFSVPVYAAKERLVLMPLRISDEDKSLSGAMETAVVKGLQQKYEVFSGEQVSKKAREIFSKESRNTSKECDETRCMQGIAEAFQAELIATTNVTKRSGGYFLALSIQNIFDNKVVYSESLPCEGCSEFQVIEKLKELAGTPAVPAAPVVQTAVATSNDADAALWNEVIKGNGIEDYRAYLLTYPNGKYVKQANTQIKKLEAEAKVAEAAAAKLQAEEQAKQERASWDQANRDATVASYEAYLQAYPKGQFAVLAQARINKLNKSSSVPVVAGKTSRACASCPDMISIPAGSFQMGSSKSSDEMPVRKVNVKSFKLMKTEITQDQWQAVMGSNPSSFDNCKGCPVEGVSWDDAQAFIKKLNAQTGQRFRLPTEAEWEYACKAGAQTEYCGSNNLDEIAWHVDNSGSKPNPVAQKKSNAFGLYDMSGNVMEWVADCYGSDYASAPTDGSARLEDNCRQQVLRGGSWGNGGEKMRAAYRHTLNTFFRKYIYMGLRLAQD